MSRKRLSAEEFERVAKQLKRSVSATNLQIARLVMVDGRRPSDAAAEFGQSPQVVSNLMSRIWKLYMESTETPEDGNALLSVFQPI
jgi:hypothetical protein